MTDFEQLLDEFAERVAARVIERMRAGAPDWIGQAASPLGRRIHCAAVRRRLASAEPGASIVGRKHLLSPEALGEELARASKGAKVKAEEPSTADSIRAELDREIRIIRGGAR